MECKRVIFPLLTTYIVVAYISFKYMEDVATKAKSPTARRDKRDTALNFQNVGTKSPPFFDFVYKSEKLCMDSNPYILILIMSGLDNRQKRDTIRNTWGGIVKGKEWPHVGLVKDVRIVFLLGESYNASLSLTVLEEALNHNDIMIGGFNDTYRNLPYKVLMGIKWMKYFCPGTQFVMKTDDDSFLHIPRIIDLVKSIPSKKTILGYFAGIEEPDRSNKSKSYVSEDEYPRTWYPPHVKGCMYVIPRNLALDILNASQRFNFLSMEDVFITGVLAEPFKVNYSGIPVELYDKNVGDGTKIDICSFIREGKVMAHNIHVHTALSIWKLVENPEICSKTNNSLGFEQH